MLKIVPHNIRARATNHRMMGVIKPVINKDAHAALPLNAKMLAWGVFLFYFIESGTLGLLPQNFYFVYRNIRVSDFIMYGLTIYSLFCTKDFRKVYQSKASVILKLMLLYLLAQFFVSCTLYDYNVLEYFFRLKGIWTSFMVFPIMLLIERKAFGYIIKLVLPVAIVSNVLYILSSITGVAFLPGIGIVKQSLPGGLEVFRVYGGTFYGEWFFLGFIYTWVTSKFRLYQLPLVILFALPQILAFGRSAWIYYVLTIIVMMVWFAMKKKNFKVAFKQVILISVLGLVLVYTFMKFIPNSDYLSNAIQARILQGQDDYTNNEGTYGTRLASVDALIQLWLNNNVLFGIGMHPLWVVKAETVEEVIYAWGFNDVGWASILAAYGLVGFLLALYFQSSFMYYGLKILKNTKQYDVYTFLVLAFVVRLFFDSVINYSYAFFTTGLWGFESTVLFVAALVCKYEHLND